MLCQSEGTRQIVIFATHCRLFRINAIPSNCIVTKLDRQQMQGIDAMCLLYFDINLYHLRTKAGYR